MTVETCVATNITNLADDTYDVGSWVNATGNVVTATDESGLWLINGEDNVCSLDTTPCSYGGALYSANYPEVMGDGTKIGPDCVSSFGEAGDINMVIRDLVFIVLTTIITVFAGYHTFKGKWNLKIFSNAMFWDFALYVVAIVVTILRIPFALTNMVDGRIIMITYNWAASLITVVSSIVPWRLTEMLLAFKNKTGLKGNNIDEGNLKIILIGALLFVVAIVITLVVGLITPSEGGATLDAILAGWRYEFLIVTVFCLIVLFRCLFYLVTGGSGKYQKYAYYVAVTTFIRLGIAITIVLKHLDAVHQSFLKVAHMSIIIIGMLAYNIALIREKANTMARVVTSKVGGASTASTAASSGASSAGSSGASSGGSSGGSSAGSSGASSAGSSTGSSAASSSGSSMADSSYVESSVVESSVVESEA